MITPTANTRSGSAIAVRIRPKPLPVLLLLAAALGLAVVVSASVGAVHLSFGDMMRALFHPADPCEAGIILFSLRLPRILAAALAGAALSATGVLFQGLFRNPLADPFVLGASGGAALGGALAIFIVPAMSLAGIGASAFLAFAGALVAMVLVWSISPRPGHTGIENMLLAGFAIGTMLNAGTSAFELVHELANPRARILAVWLYGQIGVPPWNQISITSLLVVASLIVALPLARRLNTLALGEEYALQLGVPVNRVRMEVVVVGALLTALAVSLGGLIGFVGLLVPHVLRLILGPDHFVLLPASALGGATFLVIADTIARSLFAPSELPVGILTAFLGGPAFLYLLHHKRKFV